MGHYLVERSLTVNAPAQKIWDQIVDVGSWPSWKPFITKARGPAAGFAPGAKFRMNIRVKGPWAAPVPVTVTRVKPHEEVAWTGGLPGLSTSVHSFILREDRGATTVSSREEFTGALVGVMLLLVTPRDLEKLHDDWLAAIKARVEGGA